MMARPTADQRFVPTAVVAVRFSWPREFAAKLQARGPSVEPVVRQTRFLRPRRLHGRLPGSPELVVHASYVRRTDAVVQLVTLECAAGIWHGAPELDGQTEQRAAQVRDPVRATTAAARLEVAPGRCATPGGR